MHAPDLSIRNDSDTPWAVAANEINAWRGSCLQCFAQVEAAVTETLLCLSADTERGSAIRLRHLVGQKLDDLAVAIGAEGPFGVVGKAASVALAEFRVHEELRVHLGHDVAKVAIERSGKWLVVLRHLSIRARQSQRSTLVLEESDAMQVQAELKRKAQKLCAVLGNLRRAAELRA